MMRVDAPLPGLKGDGDGLVTPVPDAVPFGAAAVVLATGYGTEAAVVIGVVFGVAGIGEEVAIVVGAMVAGCEAAEELPELLPAGASQKMVSM